MAPLSRETPEMPAETLFSPFELIALQDFATERGLPPSETYGAAAVTMATLGGYLNRRGDGPPGLEVTWRDYTQLATMAGTYERLLRLNRSSELYRTLRPDGRNA